MSKNINSEGGVGENDIKGGWVYRGVVYRRGLKPSAHYASNVEKIKCATLLKSGQYSLIFQSYHTAPNTLKQL